MENVYEEILKFLNDCGFDLTGEQLDEIAVRVAKKTTLKKRKNRPFLRGAGASRFKLPPSKYLSRYGVGRLKIKEGVTESTKLKEPLKFYDRGQGHGDRLKMNPTRKKKLDDKYNKHPKLRLVKELFLSELSNEKLHAYKQAAYDDVNKELDKAAEKHGDTGVMQHANHDRIDKRMKGTANARHKLASRNTPKDGFYGFYDGPVWRRTYRAEETEITELTDKTMLKAADRHLGMSMLHQRISPKRFEHGGKALKILTHSLGRNKRILNTPNHPDGKAMLRFSEDFMVELSNKTLTAYSDKAWGKVLSDKKLATSYRKWDKRLTKSDNALIKATGKSRFTEESETIDEMKYPTEKKAKKFERGAFIAKMKSKYTNKKDRKEMRTGSENPHTSTPGPGSSVLYDLKGNGSL